ncbi:hypothetical protein NXV96_22680 [Bacteroides fragilis]|nr:hypothetical protein [Bacteroides fragilis]
MSKRTGDTVHRFGGGDGNVVLHEWDTDEALRPEAARHGRDRARGIRRNGEAGGPCDMGI